MNSTTTFRPRRETESYTDYLSYQVRKLKAINARYRWIKKNQFRIREYVKKNKQLQEELLNQYLIILAEQGPDALPQDPSLVFNTFQREVDNFDIFK